MRASGYTASTAASPVARWSGWLAKMNSRFRSGDWVTHPLGPDLADDAADVTPQLERRLDHAVGVPEEAHVADADDRGGGALLVLAQRRHVGPGHRAVGAAGRRRSVAMQ